MATTLGTVNVTLEMSEALKQFQAELTSMVSEVAEVAEKAGKRHGAGDIAMMRDLRQKLHECDELLGKLGLTDDEIAAEAVISDGGNPNEGATPGSEVVVDGKSAPESLDSEEETTKSISLDETVNMVRDAFWTSYCRPALTCMEEPRPNLLICCSVFGDHIIVKKGTSHYKVGYSFEDDRVVFAAPDQWEAVEQEWVTKSFEVEHEQEYLASVKSIGNDRVGMYLVMWGNEKERDLTNEYFTPKTEGLTNIFKSLGKLPLLYHHGADEAVKTEVVGIIDTMEPDAIGLWTEAQLEKASKYKRAVAKMARQGALGSSSGALPASRKVSKNGEIVSWAIVEGSLTPTPADPRQRTDMPVSVLKSIYAGIGLNLPIQDEATEQPSTGDEESQKADDQERELELERQRLSLVRIRANIQ